MRQKDLCFASDTDADFPGQPPAIDDFSEKLGSHPHVNSARWVEEPPNG